LPGPADTVVPVVEDNPVEGLHVYDVPPPAVNDTDCPLQMTGAAGEAVIEGSGLTVNVTLFVLLHPPAIVPVTV